MLDIKSGHQHTNCSKRKLKSARISNILSLYILYYIILYYIISYYIILYHIILFYIILYYIILYHIISYYIILSYHIILYYIIYIYVYMICFFCQTRTKKLSTVCGFLASHLPGCRWGLPHLEPAWSIARQSSSQIAALRAQWIDPILQGGAPKIAFSWCK